MPTDPLPALLAFAAADDNIRAVLLQGSRANPNGLVDRWSDYDVAFVTRSNEPYLASGWFDGFVRQFGPVAVAQQPDDPALFDDGHDPRAHYAFLTQFADGLRLDLTFVTVDSLDVAGLESATVVLRDLDGVVPVRPPSDAGYRTPAPSAKQFAACCDEFWWTVPYVAKAVARGQTLAALELLGGVTRPQFTRMLCWLAVADAGTPLALGKHAHRLGDWIPDELRAALLASYPRADLAEVDAALATMVNAFGRAAARVAEAFGFEWCPEQGTRVVRLLSSWFG